MTYEAVRQPGSGHTPEESRQGLCFYPAPWGQAGQEGLYARPLIFLVDYWIKMKRGLKVFGGNGAGGIGMLVRRWKLALTWGSALTAGPLKAMLPGLVNRSLRRNPDGWASIRPRRLNSSDAPDCPFYPGNEEVVDAELDYLVDTKKSGGGVWNITWT